MKWHFLKLMKFFQIEQILNITVLGGVSVAVFSVSVFDLFEFQTGFWDKTDTDQE